MIENRSTHFFDGHFMVVNRSTLFFDVHFSNLVTAADKMHLRMNDHRHGDFLPTVNEIRDKEVKNKFQTADVFNDKGHPEFVAGDTRCLENPTLSAFHTMFARLHNLAVDGMLAENPEWRDDPARAFEEARLFSKSVTVAISTRLPLLDLKHYRRNPNVKVSVEIT